MPGIPITGAGGGKAGAAPITFVSGKDAGAAASVSVSGARHAPLGAAGL